MPNHFILHKGLIVDVGDHSFELQRDVEAASMSDTIDIAGDISMHDKLHISEITKLSTLASDFDIVAGGDLEDMASAEKVQ